MGCIQSTPADPSPKQASTADKGSGGQQLSQPRVLPQYVTADPDLGWRNITEGSFPVFGFGLAFQNERSGSMLSDLDLISLALNIARRAANLADQFGVTDARDLQSQMNILEGLDPLGGASAAVVEDVDKDMQKIMKKFGCPRFNWRLISRIEDTSKLIRSAPEVFLQTPGIEDRAALSELAAVPDYLQLLKNQEGKLCIVDVAEVGMNIAEQLLRLEKSETGAGDSSASHSADKICPNDLFGWKILDNMSGVHHSADQSRMNSAVPVASPDGDALMLVPEELIMNVASWVQATYLTAPAF